MGVVGVVAEAAVVVLLPVPSLVIGTMAGSRDKEAGMPILCQAVSSLQRKTLCTAHIPGQQPHL